MEKSNQRTWQPSKGDFYYSAEWSFTERQFAPWRNQCQNEDTGGESSFVFRTEEECRTYCNKLNEAMEGIKRNHFFKTGSQTLSVTIYYCYPDNMSEEQAASMAAFCPDYDFKMGKVAAEKGLSITNVVCREGTE